MLIFSLIRTESSSFSFILCLSFFLSSPLLLLLLLLVLFFFFLVLLSLPFILRQFPDFLFFEDRQFLAKNKRVPVIESRFWCVWIYINWSLKMYFRFIICGCGLIWASCYFFFFLNIFLLRNISHYSYFLLNLLCNPFYSVITVYWHFLRL